jgi:hypothetical protein
MGNLGSMPPRMGTAQGTPPERLLHGTGLAGLQPAGSLGMPHPEICRYLGSSRPARGAAAPCYVLICAGFGTLARRLPS